MSRVIGLDGFSDWREDRLAQPALSLAEGLEPRPRSAAVEQPPGVELAVSRAASAAQLEQLAGFGQGMHAQVDRRSRGAAQHG